MEDSYLTDDKRLKGYWWDDKTRSGKIYESVFSTVRFIDKYQVYKRQALLEFMSLYGNRKVFGLGPNDYTVIVSDRKRRRRPRMNICKSVVDTVTSKIGKERPRPKPLTEKGDYSLQRRARLLGQFIDGVFDANNVYRQGRIVFRDGCIANVGWFKVYSENGAIIVERVFPSEMVWDDGDAAGGKPRNIYQRKFFAKEVAKALYPKFAGAIDRAPAPPSGNGLRSSSKDIVEAIEAWHLPSGEDSSDGRHAICFQTCSPVDLPWERDHFPFASFYWSDPVIGLSGDGLVEQLSGIQVSINKHLETIERCLGLYGKTWVFVSDSCNVAQAQLTNELDTIITYTGDKVPTIVTPQVVPPDLREQIGFLFQQADQLSGVTKLAQSGIKPAGLNSAPSLREYEDIQSERFATTQQSYEQLYCDTAKLVIEEANAIYSTKEGKKLAATVKDRKFIEKIRFGDVDLKDDQYELAIYPTSMLPKDPAGRQAQVQEWIQAQWITREEGMRLMDMPDLEEANSLATAFIEDIDALIESFIYDQPAKGEDVEDLYEPPDPIGHLAWGINRMKSAYLRSKRDGVPEERRNLMTRWMDEAIALMKPPTPAPGAPPGAGGPPSPGGPPGPGAPPPGPPPGVPPGPPPPPQG